MLYLHHFSLLSLLPHWLSPFIKFMISSIIKLLYIQNLLNYQLFEARFHVYRDSFEVKELIFALEIGTVIDFKKGTNLT